MSEVNRRRHGLVLGHRQRCPTGLDGLELRLPFPDDLPLLVKMTTEISTARDASGARPLPPPHYTQ